MGKTRDEVKRGSNNEEVILVVFIWLIKTVNWLQQAKRSTIKNEIINKRRKK